MYGENQRKDTALALFIKLKEKKPITLTETSPGSDCKTGRRDFIYVGDIIRMLLLQITSQKKQEKEK